MKNIDNILVWIAFPFCIAFKGVVVNTALHENLHTHFFFDWFRLKNQKAMEVLKSQNI